MDYVKYRDDVKRIAREALALEAALVATLRPELEEQVREATKLEKLPGFDLTYQSWYSEALSAVQQLLPARLDYTLSDYLESHPGSVCRQRGIPTMKK